jgi:serine/threonine-protein kinase
MPPYFAGYRWAHGYADVASSDEDAREALAALPAYAPIPGYWFHAPSESGIGRTHLLAGRVDEAIGWLRRAAGKCRALREPFEDTRAHFDLGRALEAKGDRAGACAEYGVVVDRWGKARPKSVTADVARARMKTIKCGT